MEENTLNPAIDPDVRWHVLTFVPESLTISRHRPTYWVEKYNARSGESLEVFAPTFISCTGKGKKGTVKPLAFHYVFVRGANFAIRGLCSLNLGFKPLLARNGADRWATVDDERMRSFMIIASHYSNSLPYYNLENVNLEEGDLVEVVDGDFPGLVGRYFPKRRSSYGNIVLRVSQNLGTVAYDINARFIRILEFGGDGRRMFDRLDAFVPVLYAALRKYHLGIPLQEDETTELVIFQRRMGSVRSGGRKARMKLQALLTVTEIILGKVQEDEIPTRFDSLHVSETSVALQAFIMLLCGVVTRNYETIVKAGTLLQELSESSGNTLEQLKEEYNFYRDAFTK